MKIRLGFVSNSSSSSFVVALDKKPSSIEELRGMLFVEGEERLNHPYDRCVSFDVDDVVSAVFAFTHKAAKRKDVVDAIACGWFDGHPDMSDFRKADKTYDWDAYEKEKDRRALKIAKEFMARNKGKVFFTMCFGDEDGLFGCTMEHGDVFRLVKHLRISCH